MLVMLDVKSENKKRRNTKGFTLLEMLIVLAIITILAVIVVPSYSKILRESESKSDLSNLAILNRSTVYYRMDIETADPFEITTNTNEFLMGELVSEGYLSEVITPLAANATFEWDFDTAAWSYYVDGEATGDAIIENFTAHIAESSIQYDTFLATSTTWGSLSNLYKPNTWNGYLEKLLERGDVESNVRRDEDSGHNTIDYQNPYSEKETVVNYNDWTWFQNRYEAYIPPAILITNEDDFAPDSTSSMLSDNAEYLKGTMVIYKSKTGDVANEQAVVYYILEDGSKSDSYSVSDVLD
jgi:type IV pilus assembly protein PilA